MKITYRTLLTMVVANEQPKKIKVGTATYTWNGCDYILNTDSRKSLSDTLTSWTTKAQTTATFIDVGCENLTNEEKEYLSAVIKPYRNRVLSVCKALCTEGEYIKVWITGDSIVLPTHKSGETYKGMVIGREYSLEELDL